jgi:DNA repair protein RadD
LSLQLRPYQRAAIDGLYDFWATYPTGNPLLVVPTGGGKSLIIAKSVEEFLAMEPATRIVQVTHVKELIEQNFKEFVGVSPFTNAGIYSASIGRRDAHAAVLFAGIQTVYKQARRIGHVDVLYVDEAHLIPRDNTTMYGRFIRELREINPNMIVVGLTATDYRLDSGRLTEGEDKLFDAVAYEISIKALIDLGFLVPLISKATATQLDVAGVAKRGGEFVPGQLQAAVDKHPITKAAVDEIVQWGTNAEKPRNSWLVFCSGVDHAYHVRDEIRSRGFSCETITGETEKAERRAIVEAFRAREIRALTNANVLTTGFNAPGVDLLVMLRPTASTSLYVQMVGRGTRCIGADINESIRNGKSDCLVLDFAGNVRRHGPVDNVSPRKPGKGDGEAPVKECPACHSLIFAGLMECPDCGHVFERDVEKNIRKSADAVPILSTSEPEWVRVTKRTFFRHEKPGGTPSIRVEYLCGMVVHKEWICPEHEGYARAKFERFWKEHGGSRDYPYSIDETLDRIGELRETTEIRIKANGKHWDITGRKLAPRFVAEAA